jgi:hypothetical protein
MRLLRRGVGEEAPVAAPAGQRSTLHASWSVFVLGFFVGLEFELRASTCKAGALPLEPFFAMGLFEIGSHGLFALAGFEPRSSLISAS